MLRGKALGGAVFAIYIFLLAPLFAVLAVSVSPKEQFAIQWAWPSLRWYVSFFEKRTFFDSLFVVSLPIALATATAATIIGSLAAIALRRYSFRGRGVIEVFVMLPLFIPSILFGAALYLFFARFNANGSALTLLVGHVLIGIPYVVRVVTAGLHGIDPAIEDAAVSLGCSRPVAFIKTVLPLIRGSILSGWVFALIMSFSDVNVAIFLSGPSTQTLPLQIFSEIRWGGDPTIAAASAVQIILVGGLLFALQRIFRVRLAFK